MVDGKGVKESIARGYSGEMCSDDLSGQQVLPRRSGALRFVLPIRANDAAVRAAKVKRRWSARHNSCCVLVLLRDGAASALLRAPVVVVEGVGERAIVAGNRTGCAGQRRWTGEALFSERCAPTLYRRGCSGRLELCVYGHWSMADVAH